MRDFKFLIESASYYINGIFKMIRDNFQKIMVWFFFQRSMYPFFKVKVQLFNILITLCMISKALFLITVTFLSLFFNFSFFITGSLPHSKNQDDDFKIRIYFYLFNHTFYFRPINTLHWSKSSPKGGNPLKSSLFIKNQNHNNLFKIRKNFLLKIKIHTNSLPLLLSTL